MISISIDDHVESRVYKVVKAILNMYPDVRHLIATVRVQRDNPDIAYVDFVHVTNYFPERDMIVFKGGHAKLSNVLHRTKYECPNFAETHCKIDCVHLAAQELKQALTKKENTPDQNLKMLDGIL